MINGKKTYIAVGGGILTVIGSFFQGGVDLATALTQILTFLGVAGLRHGVDKK